MAKISRFILNSDYTAVKEKSSFSDTLTTTSVSVPAFGSRDFYKDITVPEGVFIENINLTWSISGDTVPSPYYIYNDMTSTGQITIYMAIYKISSTKYRLRYFIQNFTDSAQTAGAATLSVKGHLFISSL